MTDVRSIIAGSCQMITRRCTQRQFLLRPDPDTTNAFIYCLAEAAQRFEIDVLLACSMSNHYHAVVYDRRGNLPEFTAHFHKMLAKCMNTLRGRRENFWAGGEQPSMVDLKTSQDVVRKLVYVATNPVAAMLVEKAHHWPGMNGLHSLLRRQPMHARRPKFFFSDDGPMPSEATLHLAIPSELGDDEPLLRELSLLVAAEELRIARERRKTGTRVLGRQAVLSQSWQDSPRSKEPRRGIRPKVAACNKWARIEALQRNREFVIAYRDARKKWIAGESAVFPPGTYWLRRFAHVPIAESSINM